MLFELKAQGEHGSIAPDEYDSIVLDEPALMDPGPRLTQVFLVAG